MMSRSARPCLGLPGSRCITVRKKKKGRILSPIDPIQILSSPPTLALCILEQTNLSALPISHLCNGNITVCLRGLCEDQIYRN